jgi:hypothetical protein
LEAISESRWFHHVLHALEHVLGAEGAHVLHLIGEDRVLERDFLGFSYGFRRAAASTKRWTRSWSGSTGSTGSWMPISGRSWRRHHNAPWFMRLG